MVYLDGTLEVHVKRAFNLPNLDYSKRNPTNMSDPYVVVKLVDGKKNSSKLGKTPTIDDCLNPKWYHVIKHDVKQEVSELKFEVMDKDTIKDDKIGTCSVPVFAFANTGYNAYESYLPIYNSKGGEAGILEVKVHFTSQHSMSVVRTTQNRPPASVTPLKIKGCIPRNTDKRKSQNESIHMHGKYIITIERAENLPNLDMSLLDKKNKTDPYCVVTFVDMEGNSDKIATTKCITDDLNPVWDETFPVNVCHEITEVVFSVYDMDMITKEKIGSVTIPAKTIARNGVEGVFDLLKKGKTFGRLSIKMKAESNALQSNEVPDCVFSLQSGNHVSLYQDANTTHLPCSVTGSLGAPYIPRSTWNDVYNDLKNAKDFIFITGWSVKASISLIRSQDQQSESLGSLLLKKAHENVLVTLLLWDEVTSTDYKTQGAMSTFDNETKEYFKNSPVKVALALRKKKSKRPMKDGHFASVCYSHHQKNIIVDVADASNPNRKRHIAAYVGGLDLTAGRYDTPEHHLFKTLTAEHKDDFYNNVVSTNVNSGPRQPWHDIHSRIEGPAANDVLKNFLDRWQKQGRSEDHLSINLNDYSYTYQGQDHWDVQVFRSITQDSVSFEHGHLRNLRNKLTAKKGKQYDNSLQRAYIHQIQKAERFIYIENQYFLGSSHFWLNCRDIGVKNLVPLEIATKVAKKIKSGEEFVVYILIPMFPEGDPETIVMQEIIHWQFHTMEMMYKIIGDAITEKGLDTQPQDYLLFFCVGKREGPESVPGQLKQPLDETAKQAFLNRRGMIYVHSKMAIFDDEYIIVGSANINDRSLGGTRDTEIAMGASQPIVGKNGQGDVGAFRKCLWAEHLGEKAPLHMEPGSIQCARKIHEMAEENLQSYLNVGGPLPEGHLLIYPLRVQSNGMLIPRKDCEKFPDTKASTVGMRSKLVPAELTT